MGRRGRGTIVVCALSCALAAGALAAPAHAAAAGTLDASCSPTGTAQVTIFSYGYRSAQVFTAGHSGSLLKGETPGVYRHSGDGDDVAMQVLAVNGAGVPTTVLASTTIPGASVPVDQYTTLSGDFDPASAAYVDEGSRYALAISTTDTEQNLWNMFGGDQCVGGLFQDFGSGFADTYTTGFDSPYAVYLAPPNDDFSDRQAVAGASGSADGSTFGGTRQPGEPDHYVLNVGGDVDWLGDHSVWYRWMALGSGPATVDTCVAEIDSILAVYTGSPVSGLTRITDNNNGCPSGFGSLATFSAVAGTTYQIAVADAGGARQDGFALDIAGPPNERPRITRPRPRPGSTISDTTPLISAFVSDSATDLAKADIQFAIDGAARRFDYDRATDVLTHQSQGLAPGPHSVEIQATDAQGKTGAKSWSFTIA